METSESKIGSTERLRREGRWNEACMFRDGERARLRREGRSRLDATDESWAMMLKSFPPLPAVGATPAQPAAEQQTAEDPPAESPDSLCPVGVGERAVCVSEPAPEISETVLTRLRGNSPDLARDILWAYERLEDRGARPEDAPSLGAWALLKWARDYRNRFFEQVLPKALAASKAGGAGGGDDPEDADPGIEEIERMLEGLHTAWEEALAQDVPGVVAAKVYSLLHDWKWRFSLELPTDAKDSLSRRLAALANDCIKAVLDDPDAFRASCAGMAEPERCGAGAVA